MFKRILSGFTALVITFLSIPFMSLSSYAANQYSEADFKAANKAFFKAVYEYTMSGEYKNNLYKGVSYGSNGQSHWVTLLPSRLGVNNAEWTKSPTTGVEFNQVAFTSGEFNTYFTSDGLSYSTKLDFNTVFDAYNSDNLFADLQESMGETGFITDTVKPQESRKSTILGYNVNKLQMDEDPKCYGSLGVIRGDLDPTFRILRVTGDFDWGGSSESFDKAGNRNVAFYDLGDTIHSGNAATDTQWANEYSGVDPTAILLTVSRIHIWYHDPQFWADKVDNGTERYKVVEDFYKRYTDRAMPRPTYGDIEVTLNCNHAFCPILKLLTIVGNSGPRGDGTFSTIENQLYTMTGLRTDELSSEYTRVSTSNIASAFKAAYGRNLEEKVLTTSGNGHIYETLTQGVPMGKVSGLFSNGAAGSVSWFFGMMLADNGVLDTNEWYEYTTAGNKDTNNIDETVGSRIYRAVYATLLKNGYSEAVDNFAGNDKMPASDYSKLLSESKWAVAPHIAYLLNGGVSNTYCGVTNSHIGMNAVICAFYDSTSPFSAIYSEKSKSAAEVIEESTINTNNRYEDVRLALGEYKWHPGYIYDLPHVLLTLAKATTVSEVQYYENAIATYKNTYKTYSTPNGEKPYDYTAFETDVTNNAESIVEALCMAIASSGKTNVLKNIFGISFSDNKPAVATDYDEYLIYAMYRYAKESDNTEIKLWVERAIDKHVFSYDKTETLYYVSKSNLTTPKTLVIQSGLDTLLAEYEALSSISTSSAWKPHLTLRVRAEIINYCAKYGLSPDSLGDYKDEILEYSLEGIKKFVPEEYSKVDLEDAIVVDIYTNSAAYEGSQFWFKYQTNLLKECYYLSKTIYIDLMCFYLSQGAVTLETYSQSLEGIKNIKWVLDTLDSSLTSRIWTEAVGEYKDNPGESLSTLYTYLVACGQISSDEYYNEIYTESNPLTTFWSVTNNNITLSKDLMTGKALSATYVPMQTNLYDPYALFDYVDMEWIEGFHSKYGFHRKALYIDTNVDAAVDSYVTGNIGQTRVATLEDLLQPEKDIVLYIDDNYYNITSISEKLGKATDRVSSEELERNWFQSFQDMMGWADETEPERMLKSAEYKTYSSKIATNNSGLNYNPSLGPDEGQNKKAYDDYLLSSKDIKTYLVDVEDYSDMTAYALVSNIYRDTESYNIIARTIYSNKPVFVSSPTLSTLSGIQQAQFDTLYNYALLKNLKGNMTVGYDTSIDVTSPIYIDVYGNIVTESGLCIVPAACNATLHSSSNGFSPIAVGFLSTYGKVWKIPTTYNLDESKMTAFFIKNEDEGVWDIRAKTILGVSMNFAALSYADPNVKTALKDWYEYDIALAGLLDKELAVNITHEVLRGAPIEYINMDYEGLNLARKVDKTGIIAASKLDSIIKSLDWDDEGSIMNIPTMSFIDNYQYIIVFVFKVLLVVIVVALMITVYIDAVRQKISGRTVLKCISTLVVGVGSVLLLPTAFDLSYYQSNKLLLQDEAEYIMLLNTEKNMSGQEVGVYEVTEPENHTQIMLRLEKYSFDWLSHLDEVVFGDSIQVLDEAYDDFLKESFICNAENVQVMNDGVYIDVQDIFNTSTLNFSTANKNLYQKVSVDPVSSFYLPYYYFLDALLTNMNSYNSSNDIYAYSTKIMRGGNVKTINLCDAYFNSESFMNDTTDVLGLFQLYSIETSLWYEPVYSDEAVNQARGSQWYVMDGTVLTDKELIKRVNLVVNHARQYVNDNKDMIGRVTDETFLKCMAMSCAIYYNNLFGVPSANSYEVYNLSNADLLRLTVCDKATTLEDSPMSFARFVYNEAGTPGVYAAVFLVVVTMFTSMAKTVITLAVFVLLLVSLYVFKILLKKGGDSVAGYLLTLLVICTTNVLYAIILKVSLAIPQTGLAPTLCIILQILVQLAYLFVLSMVLIFALRDWRNIGATFYREAGSKLAYKLKQFAGKVTNRKFTTASEDADARVLGTTDTDKLERLRRRQARRERKVGES